ncbi:MAG: glycosyltransferase family 39 protein [Chthoniobacterales bacterium]
MRIAAPSSSGRKAARADFSAPSPLAFIAALESDWMFWVILALAAGLRFFLLAIKPPHFDEGINGWFVDQMVRNGFYQYDPTNYHGPLHFYILFLSQTLFGRNLWALRTPVVLGSIASVWLALRYDSVLPKQVARLAALAMAISPGFIFYGRYSIHEVWLLLFSMMFMLGVIGLWQNGTLNYLWYTGIGITGMILTKETYIIHIGCALIALPIAYVCNLLIQADYPEAAPQEWHWLDLVVVCGTGLFAIVFFYSGTFFHWNGVKGLYQTFHAWFQTGHNGNGHEKPFYYWLLLISRYEWPVCAGLLCAPLSLWFRSFALRYLTITGVGIFIGYSIVHYKTPWCIISIIWPLLFMFAAAVTAVAAKRQFLAASIAAVLLTSSLVSAVALNYFRCTTFTDLTWDLTKGVTDNLKAFFASEPYVYVQTYNDIYKLTTPVLDLAHRNPIAYHLTGHIIRTSPYPLPWILGDFPNVGYYENQNGPPNMDGDFLLVQEDRIAEVEAKLHDNYYTEPLTIRPYQDTSKLYLRASVFKDYFRGQAPTFVGRP